MRSLLKNDLEAGGRAYAALQLDYMHAAMRALGWISDQLEAQRQLSGLHERLDEVARELTLRLARLSDDVRATRAAAEEGRDASRRIEELIVGTLRVARGATTNFPEAGVRRNPGFVGRERELTQLHARLAGASTAITEAVVADGGLGKSQLAVEYAFRHAAEWDGRWFVDCRSSATVEPHVRQILSAFGVPPAVNEPFESMLAVLRSKLSQGRHLLLLDDLRDPADLERLCPADGGSRALATTRRTDLPPHLASTLSLDVLDPQDARTLLRQGRDDLCDARHDAALDAAADHLGRHALALAFANAAHRPGRAARAPRARPDRR